MDATLYLPDQLPQRVSAEGLILPDIATGYARVPVRVSAILNCSLGLVDVLASGPHYVAYSVFDCEGDTNQSAMYSVALLSGASFDSTDNDSILCGPVLIVSV